jgi:hypothetical protein
VAEAALAAGAPEVAAGIAEAVVDRVYRQMDQRKATDGAPLPGVAPEFWPEPAPDGALLWQPAEAYGWGAQSVVYLLRYLIGFVDRDDIARSVFPLHPLLPPDLRTPNTRYTIRNLAVRGRRFDLSYFVLSAEELVIALRPHNGKPAQVVGAEATHADGVTQFPARWGGRYAVGLD